MPEWNASQSYHANIRRISPSSHLERNICRLDWTEKKLLERGLGCPWIQHIFLDYSEAQRLPWRGHSKQYGNCNNCNILQQLQYGICNKLVRGQRRCRTTLIMIKGGKNQEGTKTAFMKSLGMYQMEVQRTLVTFKLSLNCKCLG